LKRGCTKLALHIGSVVVLWERLGDYHRRWWPDYKYTWFHSFVCFAGVVEESASEKYSETALSLAANDVFGNYWWYAFNYNVCFSRYGNVATLKIVH
jgi:hypothetical protein